MSVEAPIPRRKFYATTAQREYRLRKAVTLSEAARTAGLSLYRASEVERFPDRARPGELERLRRAVDLVAKEAVLRLAEAAVDRQFDAAASVRIDRALQEVEDAREKERSRRR